MCAFIILINIAKSSFIEVLPIRMPLSVVECLFPTALPIQCVVRHLGYCPYNRGTRYHFRLSFSVMSGLSFFVICLYVWKPYFLPSCYFSIGLLDFAYSRICHAENFYVYIVRSISLKMWNFVLVLGPFHSKVIKESSIVKIGSLLIRTNLRRYK